MGSRLRKRWVLGAAAGVLLVCAGLWAIPPLARAAVAQPQVRQAIVADISYRNGRMVTPTPSSSFTAPAFPTLVTAAEESRLEHAPRAGDTPDTFVGFTTSIAVTSTTWHGDDLVVGFTETTWMPRPSPAPVYGYATPQVADLSERNGVWLVDSIVFAPGSGMDGATCRAGRWAGDC